MISTFQHASLVLQAESQPLGQQVLSMQIVQATLPEHQHAVQSLFAEYLRWVCPTIFQQYRAVFDAESMIAHDMETIDIFMPPQGILLLAFADEVAAGCACTRTIGRKIAEMKRMYVRPVFRNRGIASALVQESIRLVSEMNYKELRLDSAGFMDAAHRVYRAAGFRDIPPYEGSEIPIEYQKHWVFMSLRLQ